MNQGHWIDRCDARCAVPCIRLRRVYAVASVSGTIHNALANFTVVATASALLPYFAPAPTTELVSWLASAAHNPNCDSLNRSMRPQGGNSMRPSAVNRETVPM